MDSVSLDLFDDVPVFLAVVREGGVRGAARSLGLGASAVSKALTRLETRLGTRLLDRSARGVALTDEGRAIHASFAVAADRALAARELARDAASRPRGTLRVSVSPVLSGLLGEAVAQLVDRHPELEVRLSVSDRVVRFTDGEVDVAVRLGDDAPRGAVRRRLGTTRFVLVASPVYLARVGRPRRFAELAGHAALRFVPPTGGPQRWGPDGMHEVAFADEGNAVVALAREGAGVARVLDFMVRRELADGALEALLPEQDEAGPDVFALGTSARMRTPRARAFVALLLRTLGPKLGAGQSKNPLH